MKDEFPVTFTGTPGAHSFPPPTSFTREEHERHCEEAGCSHPAYLDFEEYGTWVEGWCFLCRTVAFGESYAQDVEDRLLSMKEPDDDGE